MTVSEELLTICSVEELEKLEDVVSASELDSMTSEEEDSSKTSLRELDELEYVIPAGACPGLCSGKLEFPVTIEELLAGISGSCCSGISALDDESEEHAVSTAATAAPKKITPSLVFVNRMF